MWKVGGYLATAALLAWVFRLWGLALVLALIGGGCMLSALVAKRRSHP